jgi:PhzF family phenazine biosynthesis protein
MPFAGHPTLGTAHVVRALQSAGNCLLLEMKAGTVDVVREAGESGKSDQWTLRTAHEPLTRPPAAVRHALAAMLGLPPHAVADTPLWVDTGAEQLVIPLASAEDVRQARPSPSLLSQHGFSERRGASMAYVWAPLTEDSILARFFFVSDGSVVEDPATGSACANLGGWFLATRRSLPISLRVHQGDMIHRPSLLHLRVDARQKIFVSGTVEELGSGTIRL